MRKLTSVISTTKTLCIFTNQVRDKIGVMFGNPETTPGGKALKFYASCRLQVQRIGAIKNTAGQVVGNRTRVKVVKNKVAPPFREAIFDIMYGQGISKWSELVDLAVQMDVVQKSGSWFSMGDERIGQGKDSVKTYLMANPEIAEQVEAKVRENLLKQASVAPKAPAKVADRGVAVSADDFDDED
jgi:recombination protein RecA